MKMLISCLLATSALLSGCAAQIMKSYVGKDVREIMVDYGQPSNAFDMGDGRRAFQWTKNSSTTMPTNVTTTGNVNAYGNTAWVNSNTQITGGQTITSSCVYTLFARWDATTSGWIVTDFNKPKGMCI